ncbi:MAG: hypothetical protein F6J93_38970 [Oscillatoria sp. SIO1A7]|nr:hypothetical protein [Oscillatoria sp. SIO1A7]
MEEKQRDSQGRYSKKQNPLHPKPIGMRIHHMYYLKLEKMAQDKNCSLTEVGREIVEAGLDLLEAIAAKSDRPLAEISAKELYELIA